MQSSKAILKRFVYAFQARQIPFRASKVVLPSQCFFTPNTSTNLFTYKSMSFFSDTARAIEETEHAHSEAHLLTEEFNLLMRSHHFNKNLVLHTLEKYLAYVSKATDAASIEEISSSHEFKQFCNYVISHLNEFKSPSDVANISIFLLGSLDNNPQAIRSLSSFLRNYEQLMTIPANILKEIMTSLFNVNNPDAQDFLYHFADQVRKSRTSYDINDYVILLDCINELLSPTNNLNPGKRSADFATFINSEVSHLLGNIDKLNTGNLVSLYEFFFEDEPTEQWNQIVQKIESRILEDIDSLSADQITRLTYILRSLGRDTHELWTLLEEEILSKLEEFVPNQLVSVLASFSSMDKGSDDLYMEIDRRLGLYHEFVVPQDLAPMVFWFAFSGKYRKKFFYMALEPIIENIQAYGSEDLIRILWAYATTNTLTEPLYRVLEQNLRDKVKTLEGNDLSLLFDSVTYLNDPNSSLFSLVLSGVKETFGDAKRYSEIDEDLPLKIYAARGQGERQYDELLPAIDDYILYRLNEEVNPENIGFFVQLGNSFGENYDHVSKNPALLSIYQRKLDQIQKERRDLLNEELTTEVEFLNVNLKGLSATSA